ncbi:MAG TPA: hypothetical protein VFU05_07780 [Cyclobacteriaceae bacterium]|nr:hypothetical protein [Cyclobacteriaceae bacterium]
MKSTSAILVLMLFCTTAFCLNEGTASGPKQPTPTLTQQYKNLKSDLELINGFRMIKMYTMDRLWTVVEDSLRAKKAIYQESVAVIAKQKAEIAGLNSAVAKIEKEKLELESQVDNILVFGKSFSKASVISVSLIVIIALLALAGFLFVAGRVSYFTTRELRKLNENLYQEFDNYKRNAVEKEIKISRELQNYRNKFMEAKIA